MKRDDRLQGGGALNQPLEFYNMVETKDSEGSLQRTPQLAWKMMGSVEPFLTVEQRSAGKEIGETWSTISIRYFRSRVPIEGMTVKVLKSGETFEVRGAENIRYQNRKVECTCRLVR